MFTLNMIAQGMTIAEAQYRLFEDYLPRQPGIVTLSNLQILKPTNISPSKAANGAACPGGLGDGALDTRMSRWSKPGVLDPVEPPRQNRSTSLEHDRAMHRRRNEIERLFRHLKGFHRTFSRFEKLVVLFLAFIHFTLIVESLRFQLV